MPFNERMLAQVRLGTLNNTLLYTPPRNMIVLATYMTIVNTGVAAANLSMYHTEQRAASNDNTIIMDAVPFNINLFYDMTMKIFINTTEDRTSRLTVTAGTANVFTLTLYGATIK